MDEAEQDQYEAHLKELFDSFDVTGTGCLGQDELTELCHVLHLEEVAPGALQETLLQDGLPRRVHFDQFKDALILILSSTLTNEESFQQPDSSPEAQPKYIKDGKRYGRRSLPEFQQSVEEFAEVTVIEPLNKDALSSRLSNNDCDENWQSQDSEEYEAEGQLRFWNPDDLNTSSNIFPSQDWIEEKLHEVCKDLGISRDGHFNRKKLVSICEQFGLQNIDAQMLEEVFHNLDHNNGTMSIEDFFYGLFKIGKPLPPSASTPYRQLKRHLSMQAFDESGRRTTPPSAMTSTISFRVFSSLDDGMGYAAVEQILDTWQEQGIENSQEILKALDFSLDGKINLAELTFALENELLIAKNGIYQAALAAFKMEIRHLIERADLVLREKDKLRLDLEKVEKRASLMATEVDDHHAAIERQNEYNLSKLDEEYKDRVAALKTEFQKDCERIQQQASKQQAELEHEIEKMKTEENYLQDRLALTLKENSRLEHELLETGEKLVKYESMMSKLQNNWENVLADKFGDLDPGSAEFFFQEERLSQMKKKYEQQCRELQDRIDELQSQLEEYQIQGRIIRPSLQSSLYEELNDVGMQGSQEPASEDCSRLNMSIEAEIIIEQLKDQLHQDIYNLQQELENTVCHYEKQLEETKANYEEGQENLQEKYCQERQLLEEQIGCLQVQISELQGQLTSLRQANSQQNIEGNSLQVCMNEKASFIECLKIDHERELQARLKEAEENFSHEKEELIQSKAWLEERMRTLAQAIQEEKMELENGFHEKLQRLMEKHTLEMEQLQQELLREHQRELQEQKQKTETVLKEKMAMQKIAESLKKQVSELKARNQQLELENAELGHRNSPNRADVQDSNQQFMKTFRQKEKEARKYMSEEWERENSQLKEELEKSKIQSSSLVSSLETELAQLRIKVHGLEQENHFLKEELENVKQLPSCLDLSELENEISNVIIKNEKLLKEKEALSEELNRYIEKTTKVTFLESLNASLREENSSLEHQNQHLKAQMAVSQDKIQNFDDIVQNVSLQVSRLKSDLRVTQQEKENLKQEAMSLNKQLQMANEKSRFLESAVHSSGIQNQQKKLCWGELELIKQEQQLLRLENEQRQRECQGAKSELSHSREKLLHSNSSMMLSPPQHPRELQEIQQQGCPVVPSEQYQQLQHQFLQAERRCQRLQEELENRPLETNMPQGGYEQLLQTMEKRMMDVEQQLRLVKQLLQDKVNQLKEQFVRNTKADEMVKDLYVENAQLLKALEMTERRQKMEEKKNYLLEEKIANLSRIIKNLTSNVGSSAQLGS
ncbi:ninein isoform X4 [Pantherophis guttatus]|uniref:Ninein isoform X4 n=1 Tax=Pantherophis guttatus TaxID=94885 RepID=A0ABM3ZN51_PANGU|nr:ninein isoform X4 [Pantherophis guttatus]